ncbi:hypothetical protein OAN96_00070 [Candidatus Gracilibacteria bacterium]|nr:hypothetical protein [Candidatus Gracilibacteria bacterium]
MSSKILTSHSLRILVMVSISTSCMLTGNVYADCPYASDIQACIDENNKGGDPRGLSFECPQERDDPEFIAYQVVLDADFTVIEDEMGEYLDRLESNKGQFYSGGKTYFDGYDEISRKFSKYGEYWTKFRRLCDGGNPDGILQKTIECQGGLSSASMGSNFFQTSSCMDLANIQLSASKYAADNILRLNRTYVTQDRQKSYLSQVRDTYSTLVDKFNYNLSLLQKIEKKYPSRTQENGVPN